MAKSNEMTESAQELSQEQLAHAQGGAPALKDPIGDRLRDLRFDFDPKVVRSRLNLCASSQPSEGPA